MIVTPPCRVADDLARFLEGNGCEIVEAVRRGSVDQMRAVERRARSIEVADEREIDRRGCIAVEIDLHMAGASGCRPCPPDAAWSLDFGKDALVAFGTYDAAAVAICIPVMIAIGCRIIGAIAVVAGCERCLFAGLGWDGEMGEVRETMDKVRYVKSRGLDTMHLQQHRQTERDYVGFFHFRGTRSLDSFDLLKR